jgi:hypothetical protein
MIGIEFATPITVTYEFAEDILTPETVDTA